MRYLIAGLGSMGRRRIRCLLRLGVEANDIIGLDRREDRVNWAKESYGIHGLVGSEDDLEEGRAEVMIVSVPPHKHNRFLRRALELNMHFFVEASVLSDGLKEIADRLKETNLVGVPSATMWFHPAVEIIREQVQADRLGDISAVLLHSGQYLPDWHPHEDVSEFYVSRRETGGAREIVPFELTWLTKIFGLPRRASGERKKTIDIPGAEDIDDSYSFVLDYPGLIINGHVDVVSRQATRRVVVVGDSAQLVWNWSEERVRVFDPKSDNWTSYTYQVGEAEDGYDENIGEKMYLSETRAFLEAIEGDRAFPNTFDRDIRVLNILYAIERSSDRGRYERIRDGVE